ncbi:hypothetical protein JYA63_07695 [Fictibacillus nanhaiensis]|uniref:Uncharacterized protein n=1 Tax=Fictibacillus nanhaiensis TaxID=742169 RepID=A0ABS2ZQ40_9BACL|nr:hypothetical protein [Fictibacillus nanhaiensis]
MIAINIASLLSKEGKKVLLLTNTQNNSFSKIKQLVDQKQSDYDHILFFSTNYLNNVDMQRLTATCDGVVLVLQEKVTKKEDMKKVKMLLQKSNTDLIGIIYRKAPKMRLNRFFGKGRKAVES